MSANRLPELKDDAAQLYEWAERVAPDEPYGIAYHLFELRRILSELNSLINKIENVKQSNSRSK